MVLLQDQGPRISRHSPTSPLRVPTYREHTVEKTHGSPSFKIRSSQKQGSGPTTDRFLFRMPPEPPANHLTSQNVPKRVPVGIIGKSDGATPRTFRTFSTHPGVNLRTGHSPQNRAPLQVAAMILRNHREALPEGANISDQFLLSTR